MASFWSCSCGERWPRTKQKCSCGKRRPKKRVAKHARTLRDDSYATYVQVSREIHGVTDESCCACGKPRTLERKCDRDHEHNREVAWYGKPRGLLCGGNRGCNVLLLPWITPRVAGGIYASKLYEHAPDADRWGLLWRYLERVEAFYTLTALPSPESDCSVRRDCL